jgi:hypothetical protein
MDQKALQGMVAGLQASGEENFYSPTKYNGDKSVDDSSSSKKCTQETSHDKVNISDFKEEKKHYENGVSVKNEAD